MAEKTPNPSLTRFCFAESAVAHFRDRRLTHPHERDPEADAALVVQISHETNSSRSYREISGAEGMMATTGTFPAEWIDFWRLPALTVLYEYTERPTRYIIHRVYYDGDALSALHIMRAVTSLT